MLNVLDLCLNTLKVAVAKNDLQFLMVLRHLQYPLHCYVQNTLPHQMSYTLLPVILAVLLHAENSAALMSYTPLLHAELFHYLVYTHAHSQAHQ